MTITKIPRPYEGDGAVTTCPECGNEDIVYSVRHKMFECSNYQCGKIYNPFRADGEITDLDRWCVDNNC